jgi:hypothetical protein
MAEAHTNRLDSSFGSKSIDRYAESVTCDSEPSKIFHEGNSSAHPDQNRAASCDNANLPGLTLTGAESRGSKQTDLTADVPHSIKLTDTTTDADRERLADFLANPQNRMNVDYSRIWKENTRVLVIGDNGHGANASAKNEITAHMNELKNSGLTHIAIEPFTGNDQAALDQYAQTRRNPDSTNDQIIQQRNQLMEALKRSWGGPQTPEGSATPPPADGNARLMEMVDAAIDNGIKVIAPEPAVEGLHLGGLDPMLNGLAKLETADEKLLKAFYDPDSTPDQVATAAATMRDKVAKASDEGAASAFVGLLEKTKSEGLDLSKLRLDGATEGKAKEEHIKDQFYPRELDWRNAVWANRVSDVLSADPQARAAVFSGAGHDGYKQKEGTINEALSDRGYDSTVVRYAGGDFPVTSIRAQKDFVPAELIPTEAGRDPRIPQGSRFAYTLTGDSRPADYFIQLPRAQEAN